jgi:REP-associated tyrosine transposase
MDRGALRRLTNVPRFPTWTLARRSRRSIWLSKDHIGNGRPIFLLSKLGFQSIIIFLTVCTRQRKSLLANARAARLLIESWQAATFWRVGRYVIMPDHIHPFCAPNGFPADPLKKWIEYWRNQATRGWPQRMQDPIWQREYCDRQLRRSESYTQKWQYVSNNPVRHGYVARAEDWPYQGELNVLEWHDT